MTETTQDNLPSVALNYQYVKDSSFENPGAPATFTALTEQPKINVELNLNVTHLQDDTFEVVTTIKTNATSGTTLLCIAEVTYAAIFTLKNIPSDEIKEQILMINCPNLTFPFARRVLADLGRDGGCPFLLIDAVDFAAIYAHRKAQAATDDGKKTTITTDKTEKVKKNEKLAETV